MKKTIFFTILILTILFVACSTAPQTVVAPTERPTKSPTPKPTSIPTDKPTATKTEPTLTPREQEFLDENYHTKGSLEEGVIYGILDESSVKYMKEGGVEVKTGDETGYALSTAEVTYYNPETKKFEKGRFVIDWAVPNGTDDGGYVAYAVDAGGANGSPMVLPKAMIEDFRKQYFNMSPEKTPFVKIMFNYNVPGETSLNKFLAKAFPEFKGKIQVVDIPGLGKVLTIKGVLPEGYPGW